MGGTRIGADGWRVACGSELGAYTGKRVGAGGFAGLDGWHADSDGSWGPAGPDKWRATPSPVKMVPTYPIRPMIRESKGL